MSSPTTNVREEIKQPSTVSCTNALLYNSRGLITAILGIILLSALVNHDKRSGTVSAIHATMGVCILFEGVPVGACALLPVFMCPMFGVLDSQATCQCLVNENILFFFVGGWLLMLLNNCGMDKRLVCHILALGGETSFTPRKLLWKACLAAFCTSALCNRELTTKIIMNYIVSILESQQSVKGEANEAKQNEEIKNNVEMKYIICNAVAISSTIGSLCIMHSALTTMAMRAIFGDSVNGWVEYPDVFNFLNYSVFAIPLALLMFVCHLGIQSFILRKFAENKGRSNYSQEGVQHALRKNLQDLGRMSAHEIVSTCFSVLILIFYFTRWSKWLNMGWGSFRKHSDEICGIKDVTTGSIFLVILHFLPKSLNFLKIFSVKKHRDLPTMKVESGILFWKFVDKNTDYSLFLVMGAGIIIFKSGMATGYHEVLAKAFGDSLTNMPWNAGIFVVVLVSVLFANLASGIGMQAYFMPLFLLIATSGKGKWPQRSYLVALAVGIGTALGFCFSSRNSPSYYVRSIGKVDWKRQLGYSFVTVIVCAILLWLFVCFYAPALWDPDDAGIITHERPLTASMKDKGRTF